MIKKIIITSSLAIFIILVGIFLFNHSLFFKTNPFNNILYLENPAYISLDSDSNIYFIDKSLERIVKSTNSGEMIYRIQNTLDKKEKSQSYFISIAAAPDGTLFASRNHYHLDSGIIFNEEIIKISANGQKIETILSINHEDDKVVWDNRILNLQVIDDFLYYDIRLTDKITLYKMPVDGKTSDNVLTLPSGKDHIYMIAGNTKENLYAGSFDGSTIFKIDTDNSLKPVELKAAPGVKLPVLIDRLALDSDNNLIFSDLFNKCVYKYANGELNYLIQASDIRTLKANSDKFLFKDIRVNSAGVSAVIEQISNSIITFDKTGKSGILLNEIKIPLKNSLLILVQWILFFIEITLVIGLLFYVYNYILKRQITLLFKLIFTFIPIATTMIAIISIMTFESMYKQYITEFQNRLAATAYAASLMIDSEVLKRIQMPSQFLNDDYNLIQGNLNKILNEGADEWNQRIFINILREYDGIYYIIADNNATNGVLFPYTFDPPAFADAVKDSKVHLFENTDSEGAFFGACISIKDNNGNIAGILHAGYSKDDFDRLHNIYINQIIGRILLSAFIFLILTGITAFIILLSVRKLSAAVKKISSGDYDIQVDIRSKDEIGELGKGFNSMSSSIRSQLTHITNLSNSYSRFVPMEFLKYLDKQNITEIELGNQVQIEMTVLFSDIRSFTTISESMSPQENFNFLNSYLKRISPVIRNNSGFIDKFIGDAIMALFPDTKHAIRAAIEMFKEINTYNQHRAKSAYEPIEIGIGLHGGKVILGILGEDARMEGTVISDTVNVASRLESLNKIYGTNLLISSFIYDEIKNEKDILTRCLGNVLVKGKSKPIEIFEVFSSDHSTLARKKQNTKEEFEKGVQLYYTQNYEESKTIFNKIIKNCPGDKPAVFFLESIMTGKEKLVI